MRIHKKHNLRRAAFVTLLVAISNSNFAQTPVQPDSVNTGNNKEEGNRNVMLNAASANGPREISIGLLRGRCQCTRKRLARGVQYQSAQCQHALAWRWFTLAYGPAQNFGNGHYNRQHRLCRQFVRETGN